MAYLRIETELLYIDPLVAPVLDMELHLSRSGHL
jgi:hypothetical protein